MIDIVGDPGTLNPTKDGGIAANYTGVLIRDRLVCVGQDGGVVPCLATTWDTPNPTTYVFHLRPNVKFSNGAPFTADDAKYSWDTIALGKDSDFNGAEGPVKETKVIDPMTFEIDLTEPDPYFLEYMSTNSDTGIMPKGYMEQCAPNCDNTSIGTGPIMLKDWVKGDHLDLCPEPELLGSAAPRISTR